jgi:FkbM family methyltransferase
MFQFDAWMMPDGETHLPKRMSKRGGVRVPGLDGAPRLTYQYPLYQVALAQCKQRRVAVDVGAHIGLFSYWMVRDFDQVVAFEPMEAHRECWKANVPSREQDALIGRALGAKIGHVALESPAGSSGGTRIVGPGNIEMSPLDAFTLSTVDLLKIDCEGYEIEIIRGADETLTRCRPVVCVEQRDKVVVRAGQKPAGAVRLLERLGARVAWTDKSDYVMVWP